MKCKNSNNINLNTQTKNLYLLGHPCVLQTIASTGAPSVEQSLPPNAGVGLLQQRLLYIIPPPQLFEHCDMSVHAE